VVQVSLAGQTGKAPGGQEVKMLPTAEAGRPDALDQAVSPSNKAGPSKPPAAAKQLQGQPGAPGRGAAAEAGMNNARTTPTRTPVGSASSSSLKAAGLLDPNRAFQAINAETLEVASAQADYPIPPVTTQVPMLLKLWQLLLLTTTVAGLIFVSAQLAAGHTAATYAASQLCVVCCIFLPLHVTMYIVLLPLVVCHACNSLCQK